MVDTTLMAEIQETRVHTQEELDGIAKYKEQLEKRKAYQREYMANRRKNDPEFAAKQRQLNNKCKKERYATDEAYRQKEKEYLKKYREEKNKFKGLYEISLNNSKQEI